MSRDDGLRLESFINLTYKCFKRGKEFSLALRYWGILFNSYLRISKNKVKLYVKRNFGDIRATRTI